MSYKYKNLKVFINLNSFIKSFLFLEKFKALRTKFIHMYKQILFLCLYFIISLPLSAQKEITLEDVQLKGTFATETVEGLRSMNDGIHYTTMEDNKRIVKHSYKTGEEVEILFNLSEIENAPISSFSAYQLSDDETKILLTTQVERIYRRSYTAEYYIWNSITQELTELSAKGRQQLATFSPNGERVAFVRDNNIFIKSLKFGTESQVTFDGKKNEIINGAPDWVYEEEFSYNKAFAWSPNSDFLAFTKFDESEVNEFSMPIYAGQYPTYENNELYPSEYRFKYPKAGENNSIVSVHVYEIESRTTIQVEVGEETDIYIPRLKWTLDGEDLAVMRFNRRQNVMDIFLANPYTGESRPLLTEKNDKYIDEIFLDEFKFLPGNEYFIVMSERDGYSHLYLYDRLGFLVKQITKGEYDVTEFYGFDPKKEIFYYQAAKESPLRREVYYISLDEKKEGKLSTLTGTNNAEFSSGFKYFINYFSSTTEPNLVTLHEIDGKQIRVLEDNQALKENLSNYEITPKEFFTFTTSEGILLNGWILKPVGFEETEKYPVVMTQYSGPNSQEVLDEWSVDWYNYLAQEGYIVACVDPRGTGARGEDFRKQTYLRLGKYESDDQVETAKYLGTLSYVDKDNIAIWGWSFGGFMTLMSMEKGGDIFKAGIAVAPLTHHKFYDTVYTERFMRTPKENPDGYAEATPFANPEGITGRLLIMHGSADDNVHLQNTMEFIETLVQEGTQFDMAIYTNRNHSIYGGITRLHLYQKMTDFLNTNLK